MGKMLGRKDFLLLLGGGAANAALLLAGCGNGAAIQSDEAVRQDPSPQDTARQIIAGLSLEQKVAQLFFVRPESFTGVDVVVAAGEDSRAAYAAYPVGGVIYFEYNLENSGQTTEMLANMRQIGLDTLGLPPFLATDEEGGTVVRVADNPGFDILNPGNMSDVGAGGSTDYAQSVAGDIAGYLLPLGFNVDFAPCCDVADNPESNTMALRSFGADAETVSGMVAAQVRGFKQAGILCAAKHFPGIGCAMGDSHEESIYSDKTLEEIQACELLPFQAAIDEQVDFVMLGHISMPNITGSDIPASLSPVIVQDILRDRMGYEGIIITDSLGMGAVSGYGPQAALMALEAGCDMLLMPEDFPAAYNAVLDAVNTGRVSESRIDESLARILNAKLRLL